MTSNLWSKTEITDAVFAYLEMAHFDSIGQQYKKNDFYQALSAKHGRTPKAFGRRMSNISYVMSLMELPIVQGLAPLANVGPTNAKLIEKLISEHYQRPYLDLISFEKEVNDVLTSKKEPVQPEGEEHPGYTESKTKVYKRSGKVKGWVLRRSKGCCELCKEDAPFTKDDGQPYLEVHHLKRLKDGGPDIVTNCVALCPNCHRKIHHSPDKYKLTDQLKEMVLHKEAAIKQHRLK